MNATQYRICAVTAAASTHWDRIVACVTKDTDRITAALDASVQSLPFQLLFKNRHKL